MSRSPTRGSGIWSSSRRPVPTATRWPTTTTPRSDPPLSTARTASPGWASGAKPSTTCWPERWSVPSTWMTFGASAEIHPRSWKVAAGAPGAGAPGAEAPTADLGLDGFLGLLGPCHLGSGALSDEFLATVPQSQDRRDHQDGHRHGEDDHQAVMERPGDELREELLPGQGGDVVR